MGTFSQGQYLVGDWQNGAIYVLDPDYYYDDCAGATGPISFSRSFQHIGQATDPASGQPVETNGQRIQFKSFYADMECGSVPTSADASPQVTLRWSNDRGFTWRNGVLQPMGPQGYYGAWPTWRNLEISRDRIFELSWSAPGPTALNGAWVEAEILQT